jgi:hypothetical protein
MEILGSESVVPAQAQKLPSVKEGAMSTLMELTIVLLICPAALAGWADARYPNLRPTDLRRTAVHLGITGLLAFGLLRPLLIGVGLLVPGEAGRATAFALACAIITYSLVVTLWVMRSAANLAGIGR